MTARIDVHLLTHPLIGSAGGGLLQIGLVLLVLGALREPHLGCFPSQRVNGESLIGRGSLHLRYLMIVA